MLPAQEMYQQDCFLEHKLRATSRIHEDERGFIWLMRADGFYRFDGKDLDFIDLTADLKAPYYHSAGFICSTEDGNYWMAARDAGLISYNRQRDSFYYAPIFKEQNSSLPIYARCVIQHPYEQSKIMVSSNEGFCIYDEHLKTKIKVLPSQRLDSLTLPPMIRSKDEIRIMRYDSLRDVVWMGGKAGLFSYNLKTDQLVRFPVASGRRLAPKVIDAYLINDIQIDGDQLIAATWFGGIMTFDITAKKWTSFPFEDQQNIVYKSGNTQLAETTQGQIFVAHEQDNLGSWYRNSAFMTRPTDQGKPIEAGIGALVDRLGYLWVGHWWKLCRYQVMDTPPQEQPSQIYIREVRIDSVPVNQRMNIWDNHRLSIQDPDMELAIQFRAINALSYEDISYEYRLGEDADGWISNGRSEWVQLSTLEKGVHNFQVRHFDPVGQKYMYSGPLIIDYQPRRLVDLSLLIGLAVLLACSIIGFFGYRSYIKRRQTRAIERYEAQLGELREAALRSQMNPHFLFNSLNSIRFLILNNDNSEAATYLTKFSRLMRMILEHSKLSYVHLDRELELLRLYVEMEQIRFEDKFTYSCRVQDDLLTKQLIIPPMLLQPYLENAILHGINPKEGPGHIQLIIKKLDKELLIRIIDDGIGRAASQQIKNQSVFKKSSLGMKITHDRIGLFQSDSGTPASVEIIDLADTQGRACGTEVILHLPLRQGT